MRSLRTSWIVMVTRRRVIRMPLSRLLLIAGAVMAVGAYAAGTKVVEWRNSYLGLQQDLIWLRARADEKRDLVQQQHRALTTIVSELGQLRADVTTLQSLKDQVRVLGHLEGEHDVSVQLARERPPQSPLDSNPAVMLGYAYDDIELLRRVTRGTSDTLSLLVALLEDRTGIRPDIPSMWPVSGKPLVTSKFGRRRSPWTRRMQEHRGIDIRGKYGKPIMAAGSGRVTYAGRDPGYGNLIVINHGSGIYTWYGHLSRLKVHKGAVVKRGEKIGAIGSTGRSTGPHLHFEVRVNGVPVNPEQYFVN